MSTTVNSSMTARPLVSIVMPSFNHARFIREAIDSVLEQDYRPIELLVMDGGSRDATVDILRSYGDRLSFVSERDKGQSDALNRGLERVHGDILCWLNSDDLFMPGALKRVVEAFHRHPDAHFVYGKGWNITEDGGRIGNSGVLPFNLWKLIHHRNFLHQPSVFFRRSLLQEVGPIREDLHYVMDWELWIRFATRPGVFLDNFLSCNRSYRENKTNSGALRRWHEIRRMVRAYSAGQHPPVVWIYLLEAVVQLLSEKWWLGPIRNAFARILRRCMLSEISGWYADGGVAPRFRFSVPNRPGMSSARLVFEPLSRFDATRLGGEPVTIGWSNSRTRGTFEVMENGAPQEFELPLAVGKGALFTHFSCRARGVGVALEETQRAAPRTVVGFMDVVEDVPAVRRAA